MAPPRGHMIYIGLYREKDETIFLSETTMPRALIWYEASPSEPLPCLFKLYLWCQKWHHPRGHMFYIGLYRVKDEKIFFKLSETIRLRALIFGM